MNNLRQWIHVISNLVLAAAVCIFVFGRSKEKPAAPAPAGPAAPATTAALDLDPLLEPIASLEESLGRSTETLQRFNTTLIQYNFLQKEIERLANIDQLAGNQLNLELQNKEQLGEEAGEAADERITQLREFQEQVQTEFEQRRQMMLQLIAGLEAELEKSNVGGDSVRDIFPDTLPTPDANTNLAPFAPPAEE